MVTIFNNRIIATEALDTGALRTPCRETGFAQPNSTERRHGTTLRTRVPQRQLRPTAREHQSDLTLTSLGYGCQTRARPSIASRFPVDSQLSRLSKRTNHLQQGRLPG